MSEKEFVTGAGRMVTVARITIWAFFGVAMIAGALTLAAGLTRVFGGHLLIELIIDQPLTVGVADGGSDTILDARYTGVTIDLAGLSSGITDLARVAMVAGIMAQAAIPLTIALIAWRLLRRAGPFSRRLGLPVTLLGAVLLIGALLSQGLNGLAAMLAAAEANGSSGTSWPLIAAFNPSQLGFGIVLLLVGLAFGYGEKLQRDTDGLV